MQIIQPIHGLYPLSHGMFRHSKTHEVCSKAVTKNLNKVLKLNFKKDQQTKCKTTPKLEDSTN